MKGKVIVLVVVLLLFWYLVGAALAEVTLVVATEDRPLQKVITKYTPEFEKMKGIRVRYVYYPSAELRSKVRLDAALGTGEFNVVYLTEANIPEHAHAGWIVPIREYYPEEYDFEDFIPAVVNILSYNGIPMAAPLSAETTWLAYRRDLFEEEGVAVPVTLDEYIEVCKKFYRPPNMYGGVVRGDRGHGYNVWRWSQFFAACGGKYMENGEWVFGQYINEAIKATEYYLEVIKTSPPGGERFSYLDAWNAFNAGLVATFICATPKYAVTEDPERSAVAGKVGYAPPPYETVPVASGAAHGYAISSVGCKTEELRKLAGEFIAWATSKEMESRRIIEGGEPLSCARKNTFQLKEFAERIPVEHVRALADTLAITRLVVPPIPQWPEIGDNLGIILEEIFTGARTDIRASLEEAEAFAQKVLKRE